MIRKIKIKRVECGERGRILGQGIQHQVYNPMGLFSPSLGLSRQAHADVMSHQSFQTLTVLTPAFSPLLSSAGLCRTHQLYILESLEKG